MMPDREEKWLARLPLFAASIGRADKKLWDKEPWTGFLWTLARAGRSAKRPGLRPRAGLIAQAR
jgi:hypothetical protein